MDHYPFFGKVKIVLKVDPPSHPDYALLMVMSRYEEAIAPHWGRMLGRLGRALTDGFLVHWDKASPGKWGVRRAELETFGVDVATAIHALPPVVSSAYGEVGILAEVRVVDGR